MNKQQVINAWTQQRIGRTPNGSLTASSDGTLRSYNLVIGATVDGERIVANFTARGDAFYSMTTSHHVSAARSVAKMVDVKEFDSIYTGDKWYR